MVFRNKNKYLMYKTLNYFNKHYDIEKTQVYIIKKYKLEEFYFAYIISQCIDHKLIDGIDDSTSLNNHHHLVYTENIYITYNGYEFLKNYYGFAKRFIGEILLVIFTATVTVLVNNYLSKTEQSINQPNQTIVQENK